jgi:hypothetical protein
MKSNVMRKTNSKTLGMSGIDIRYAHSASGAAAVLFHGKWRVEILCAMRSGSAENPFYIAMSMEDELSAYREVRLEQIHKRNGMLLGKHANALRTTLFSRSVQTKGPIRRTSTTSPVPKKLLN